MICDYPNLSIPKSDYLDGSYALFREDSSIAKVVSDPAALRTIWYYFDEQNLISSTSQLAVVRFLGNFEFNHDTVSCMHSSGKLGPSLSWDKRLLKINSYCSIILNKKEWALEKRQTDIFLKEGNEMKRFKKIKLKTLFNIYLKI